MPAEDNTYSSFQAHDEQIKEIWGESIGVSCTPMYGRDKSIGIIAKVKGAKLRRRDGLCENNINTICDYPVHVPVCAAGLWVLVSSVCVCMCGLLHPCTDRVIHAFPNETWRFLWPRNIFLWAFTTHHTLWARLISCNDTICVLQHVFQTFSSSNLMLQQLQCYYMHVCSRWNFRLMQPLWDTNIYSR